jgi:hypothetical protein
MNTEKKALQILSRMMRQINQLNFNNMTEGERKKATEQHRKEIERRRVTERPQKADPRRQKTETPGHKKY